MEMSAEMVCIFRSIFFQRKTWYFYVFLVFIAMDWNGKITGPDELDQVL